MQCHTIKILQKLNNEIMKNWLTKCSGIVRWTNCFSSVFNIYAGVRQGGLLSPALFAVYMDKLIARLKASSFGCCIKGI